MKSGYIEQEERKKSPCKERLVNSLCHLSPNGDIGLFAKKKVGAATFYSKYHFYLAKGLVEAKEPEYYTYPEAMAKYGLTRDQLHHYLKYHNITRVKKGKYTHILRSELDNLFKSPEI